MCILFSYMSKRCLNPNEFKLILLSNRDEYFNRPSKPASFVNDVCLYGQDMTQGKEGGTWLGMNKYGKISALLNLDKIDYSGDDPNKAGRGFMIPNYLNNSLNSFRYIHELIKPEDKKYNPFNLVFYEKNNKTNLWEASLFDNFSSRYNQIDSDFFSISNHLHNRPYPKTVAGEKMFRNIVAEYNSAERKLQLLEKLLELGKYDAGKKFEHVAHLGKEAARDMMQEQVCINIPTYGTRTHSVILIDGYNRATYFERTLTFPIDEFNKKWEDKTYHFELL